MKNSQVLMTGPMMPLIIDRLDRSLTLHRLWDMDDPQGFIRDRGAEIGGIATGAFLAPVTGEFLSQFPNLKMISNFGVGYDTVDAVWAGENGVIVTNTPDVLTEETADTAFGLMLMTVREFSQSERYLRAGRWEKEGAYPLSRGSLRNRTLGIAGLGRIGKAIARRAEGSALPVAYHGRSQQEGVAYPYFAELIELARAVDILMVVMPGGADTDGIINAEILDALGPDGVLINIARGSVVDEPALIAALEEGRIMAAGLDVFANEPHVPARLMALENAVLLPHLGSGSIVTRDAMANLTVDNLIAWAKGEAPLTPVKETIFSNW